MKMTPVMLVLGSVLIFWCSIFCIIILPPLVMEDKPSPAWRAWTPQEAAGHQLYNDNGCSYCHSMFVRTIDWGHGAVRIADEGDYYSFQPAILGTERTGPDLSTEGGERPDDWHLAHFINPRHTRPMSLMPSWEFLGRAKIEQLTRYIQSQGGKIADPRVQRQEFWKKQAVAAHNSGEGANVEWIHAHVPDVWRRMPNPYPADPPALARGKKVYQESCIGCHGDVGDGNGPAAPDLDPPPLNFTLLRNHLVEGKYIGGIFYYQVMNGITGTAMPYFKKELESEKIWDVSNYLAASFVGHVDSETAPGGIPAAYELVGEMKPPAPEGAKP